MGVTAEQGPLVTFGQGQSFDSNPEAGPSAWYQGDMLLDPRGPYTYQPGQQTDQPNYGWYTSTAIALIDQIPSAVSATNIVNAATPVAGTALTLVSSTAAGITVGCSIVNAATGAVVTGLLGIDVNTAAAPQPPVLFGQGGQNLTTNAGPQTVWNPLWAISRCLLITTNGNDSTGTYVIKGFDQYFYPMTQTMTGPNSTTGATLKAFKYIQSITPAGTIASTSVNVGTTDTYGIPLRADRFPYLNAWWGTPQALIGGGSTGGQTTLEIPVTLSALANSQAYALDVPFDGKLVSMNFRVTAAATTSGKAATLTAQANGSSVTGGVVALTSANCTPIGAEVAGTAITAANTFTAGQTVGFIVSSVTTFVEGAGIVELVVQNSDATGGTFVGAVTTSPATALTGDVRGTMAMPSASDGTKRLTLFWSPVPSNMPTTAGLVGVTQF